jgi:hypothetical protein
MTRRRRLRRGWRSLATNSRGQTVVFGSWHPCGRALVVVHLYLLSGQERPPIEPLGLLVAQPGHEAFDRVIGAGKAVVIDQIPVRTKFRTLGDPTQRNGDGQCRTVGVTRQLRRLFMGGRSAFSRPFNLWYRLQCAGKRYRFRENDRYKGTISDVTGDDNGSRPKLQYTPRTASVTPR